MKSSKPVRTMANILFVLCAAAALIAVTASYIKNLEIGQQEEISRNLREVSLQSVKLLQERIQNDFMQIEGASQSIAESGQDLTDESVLRTLQKQVENTNFDVISVADANGRLYSPNGSALHDISNEPYFQSAMQGLPAISDVFQSAFSDRSVLVMSAPVLRGGAILGAVLGRYDLSDLSHLLQIDYFDGQGYSYMAKSTGEVFISSHHPLADPNFKNIATDFTGYELYNGQTTEKVLEDMRSGQNGEIYYEWNGVERIMNYTAVGVNDWYLLSVIPRDVVTSKTAALFQQAVYFACTIILIFAAVALYALRARSKSQKKLEIALQELMTLYNALPGGVFRCRNDACWTVLFANDGFFRFLGYTRSEFSKRFDNQMAGVIYPNDLQNVAQAMREQLKKGTTVIYENRLVCADGSIKWIWINAELTEDGAGGESLYCTFVDITSQKMAQEQVRLSQERYEIIMNQTQDIVFEWNIRTRTIYHSKNFKLKFGYEPVDGNFPQSAVDEGYVHAQDIGIFLDTYHSAEQGEKYTVGEFRIKNSKNEFIWCRTAITTILGEDGLPFRVVGIISDIQEQKRMIESIEEYAKRDSLTGLYNKGATEMLIREYLENSKEPAALMMLDVDDFKTINDTYGHPFGDYVLAQTGKILTQLFRGSDITGRIGGDEFMVFMPNMYNEESAGKKADALIQALYAPMEQAGVQSAITCSIGIAFYPRDASSFDSLVGKADIALYHSKKQGKNQRSTYQSAP